MRVNLTDIQTFTSHSMVIFGYFDVGHLQRNPLGLRLKQTKAMTTSSNISETSSIS